MSRFNPQCLNAAQACQLAICRPLCVRFTRA